MLNDSGNTPQRLTNPSWLDAGGRAKTRGIAIEPPVSELIAHAELGRDAAPDPLDERRLIPGFHS